MGVICPLDPTTLNVSRVAATSAQPHLFLTHASLKDGILFGFDYSTQPQSNRWPKVWLGCKVVHNILLGSSGTIDQTLMNVSLPTLTTPIVTSNRYFPRQIPKKMALLTSFVCYCISIIFNRVNNHLEFGTSQPPADWTT